MKSIVALFVCILHVTHGKLLNVDLILKRQEACLFPQEEVWGTQFVNKSADIVKLNVVINDTKLDKLLMKDSLINIIESKIIYDDAELAVRKERERIDATPKWNATMPVNVFFDDYRDWIEYEILLEALLVAHPDILSKSFMSTQTIQGRDIPIFTLSTDGDLSKPGFYIQAEIHAREWLANMAVMYILNELAEGYDNGNERIVNILNNINIFIVPCLNIDGYIFSWTSGNRFWRKNRRDNVIVGSNSFGVDLNRNYDGPTGTWCNAGASTNPTSDSYCGSGPFSEPETRASRDFVMDIGNNVVAAWDMHTSGQLILLPWAFTTAQVPNWSQYLGLGQAMQSAMLENGGVNYNPIQTADFCTCSGSSVDFFHSTGNGGDGNTLGMGWEGRGPGFNPNPSNIPQQGAEQLEATLVMAEALF